MSLKFKFELSCGTQPKIVVEEEVVEVVTVSCRFES